MDLAPHAPFSDLIPCCVRGHEHAAFNNTCTDDHIAELCLLQLDDTEDFFYLNHSPAEGVAFGESLDRLVEKIHDEKDLAAAELLYAVATHAAYEVLRLYLRNRDLFDQIAPRRKLLPTLASIHPNTAKVVTEMEKDGNLGRSTRDAGLIKSKAWFTNDAPANVYARTIIMSIQTNRNLKSIRVQRESWFPSDLENGVRTRILPFPKYITGIELLPVPLTPACVLDYWRKGKEIILEEMPEFHLRPEWKDYHGRNYKNGPKIGAVKHAIFKDILVALTTIAGRKKPDRTGKTAKRGSSAK